jgi:CTP synthase
MSKYIFITGGVVSSLGKGVCAASVAALLQVHGYKVRLKKLDPYFNVDPGTMSPYQHGEVFVTADGVEVDLDFGYYERFTGIESSAEDTITSGKLFNSLIEKERRGDYLGRTVQMIPNLTDIIKNFIKQGIEDTDFMICEIGGTVGDIEALPYLEALRQIKWELSNHDVMSIHLTLIPYIAAAGELKTKPTQHSVRELRSIGIQPDLIICRADREISNDITRKIALTCSVPENMVVSGIDKKSIYNVPLYYLNQKLDEKILSFFKLQPSNTPDLSKWRFIESQINNYNQEIKIAIVGKYSKLQDAYKSLVEACLHAGLHIGTKVNIVWVDTDLEQEPLYNILKEVQGIIIPGGFGSRGIEKKIMTIEYARRNQIPLLGICLGMQLMAIEFARNILGITDANSTEFSKYCTNIIDLITNWGKKPHALTHNNTSDLGGTMRLGNYRSDLTAGSKIREIYGINSITERHRHRFEFNINYKEIFEDAGMIISGLSADLKLVEALELKDHPWFIGVQFHPEYKSRPFEAHPLFLSFIKTSSSKLC